MMNYYVKRMFKNEFSLNLLALIINVSLLLVILITYPLCDRCSTTLIVIRSLLMMAILLSGWHAIRQSQIVSEELLLIHLSKSKWVNYVNYGIFVLVASLYLNVIGTSSENCLKDKLEVDHQCTHGTTCVSRDTLVIAPKIPRDTLLVNNVIQCNHIKSDQAASTPIICKHNYGSVKVENSILDSISLNKLIDAINGGNRNVKVDTLFLKNEVNDLYVKRFKGKKINFYAATNKMVVSEQLQSRLADTNTVAIKSIKIKNSDFNLKSSKVLLQK